IPELQRLPRLSLPGVLAERLRRPTVKSGMSTIEALAAALDLLGDAEAARALNQAWQLAVERGLSLRRSVERRDAMRAESSAP
ncbi:MAG: DTW domain-containing protein, partial [Deltaproteobacteria bacterium]|nr:DTW domain-containing protein [Deltaproteobacteria bacterium]